MKKNKINLEKIIHVSGKSGLYKILSQAKNMFILESLIDKKRASFPLNSQINMLEDIGIYTYDNTKPLSEIFTIIAEKEDFQTSINHKLSQIELTSYFKTILDDYDDNKVYISDIRKVIQWYNILHKSGYIKKENK